MRVLWFSTNPSLYDDGYRPFNNGGGWIGALERIVRDIPGIELAVAFEHPVDNQKRVRDRVTYYPIRIDSLIYRLRNKIEFSHQERYLMPRCMEIVNDFKPDIIECFGSEWCFGLIAALTDVPVVTHLQGLMAPCHNTLYPPRYNSYTEAAWQLSRLRPHKALRALLEPRKSRQRVERERRVMLACHNYMGRTEWDKSVTSLLSPGSRYFTCNEALRPCFIDMTRQWGLHNDRDTLRLCTTVHGSLWKGLDIILKTARCLHETAGRKVEWHIIGSPACSDYVEWMEKDTFARHNVRFLGVLDADTIKEELLDCDLYIQPSYIDNSPNSLCEAMALGVPCIASATGGIPSIITHGVNGLLTQVNDPYALASAILRFSGDPDMMSRLSSAALSTSRERHAPETIAKQLIEAYQSIMSR